MILYQVLGGDDSHNRRRTKLDDDEAIFLHKFIVIYEITIKNHQPRAKRFSYCLTECGYVSSYI